MPTITIDDLPAELRATAGRLRDGGINAMRRSARRALAEVHAAIATTDPYAPVDTGQYRRAWTVQNVDNGADLFNPELYAPVIEFGSQGFPNEGWTPPLEPLIEWGIRKMRGLHRDKVTKDSNGRRRATRRRRQSRGRARARSSQASAAAQDRVAVGKRLGAAAWMAIRRRGFAPRRVLERASERFLDIVDRELTRALIEEARRR